MAPEKKRTFSEPASIILIIVAAASITWYLYAHFGVSVGLNLDTPSLLTVP